MFEQERRYFLSDVEWVIDFPVIMILLLSIAIVVVSALFSVLLFLFLYDR